MTTDTSTGPVVLRCSAAGCKSEVRAQLDHLPNLLAAGEWLCAEHKEETPC